MWWVPRGIVLVAIVLVVFLKASPDGGRPAGQTRLMSAARAIVLLVAVIALVAWFLG